jgi:hypothetical protein
VTAGRCSGDRFFLDLLIPIDMMLCTDADYFQDAVSKMQAMQNTNP